MQIMKNEKNKKIWKILFKNCLDPDKKKAAKKESTDPMAGGTNFYFTLSFF